MSAATELWVVRHGETEWSKSGAHTGHTEVPLTGKGRDQARRVGEFLAGRPFDAVMVSPLARARETCELAGYAGAALVEPGLIEWNYGDYEGKSTAEIRETVPGWSVWKDPIPGGETLTAVGARADAVIARALEVVGTGEKLRVLLFAHAHLLRILGARWIRLQPGAGQLFTLSTGSLSQLGWERETRVLAEWNRSFEES